MYSKFKIKKKNSGEKTAVIFLTFLSFHSVFQYYVDFEIIPSLYLYFFYIIAFSLPFILLSRPKSNLYRQFFLICFFITFLISFLFLYDDFGTVVFCLAIYFNLLSAYFSYRISIQQWMSVFKILAIISIFSSIYLLIREPIDFSLVILRSYSWGKLFYFATLYWAVIPFVLLSFLTKKYRYLSVAYWIFAIIVNSLFLKRFIILDTALLLIALLFISPSKKKLFLQLFFFIIVSLIIFNNYENNNIESVYLATSERFNDVSDEGGQSRIQESINYFNNNNILQVILGKGFASAHTALGKDAFALHIGWMNFIFKGGFLLFFIVLRPYFKVLCYTNKLKTLPLKIQFSYWFLIIYFFKLLYTNMFNLSPESIIFFYCIFSIIDFTYNKKTIDEINC